VIPIAGIDSVNFASVKAQLASTSNPSRNRALRAFDIGYALSIEDAHLVSYSLRRLMRLGLMNSERTGKEIYYFPTKESEPSYLRYLAVRKEYLISAVEMVNKEGYDLEVMAKMLRAISPRSVSLPG
jgi:predicted MarR family transcription regulator